MRHTFEVRRDKEGEAHEIAVNFPSYEEATEAQRKAVWHDARANITVKVQGTLRRRLEKGVRGDRLQKEAQSAVNAVLSGISRRAEAMAPLDAKALKLSPDQIKGLREQGIPVSE
jgi:hypothetical protein